MRFLKVFSFVSALGAATSLAFGAEVEKSINLNTWGSGTLDVPSADTYKVTFSGATTTATFNKTGNGSVTLDNQSFGLAKWSWKGAGNLIANNCNIAISGNFESYGNWNWQTNVFNDCTLTVGGTFVNQCDRNRNYANATIFNGGTYTFATLACDSSDADMGANVYVRGGSEVNISSGLFCSRTMGGLLSHARFVVEDGAVTVAPEAAVALSWFDATSGALELLGGTFTAPYVGGGNSTNDYVLGNGGTFVVNKAGTDALQASNIEHFYLGENGLTLSTDHANTTASAVFTNWGEESGALTKAGTGTLTLTGDGSTHGKTVVSTGTLKFGTAVTTHPAVEVAGGATLDLTVGKPVLAGLSFAAGETSGSLLMNASDTLEISGEDGFDPSNLGKLTFVDYAVPHTYEVVRVAGSAGAEAVQAWAAMPYDEVAEILTTFDAVYDEDTDTTTFRVIVEQDKNVKRQVTVSAGVGGSVDFENGKYLVDTVLTIEAVANKDYTFVGWTGAPAGQELDNPLVVTVAGEDITLAANFQQTAGSGELDLTGGDVTLNIGPGCSFTATSVKGNASANLTVAGGGTLVLPETDLSTAFATLTVDGVTVKAVDGTSLGAGSVLIRNGGGIVFSAAFTLANIITVESGSTGFLTLAEGTTKVAVGKLVTAGATFYKLGPGQLYSNGNLNAAATVGDSRWICDEGEIMVYGEKWGATGFYIEMHEGTVLRRGNNVNPLGMGNVVLRGAQLVYELPWNSVNNDMLHATTAHFAAGSFGLQALAATNGVPSYVTIDQAFSTCFTLNVDVAEGAELNLNSNLRGSGASTLVSLKKTGAGRLRLLKSPYDRCSVNVAEGTLALSGANVRIGKNVSLVVGENAQIELEKGAVLDNAGISQNALIAEAQVHLDALAIASGYAEGAGLPSIANRGSSCGAFFQTSPAAVPVLTHDSFKGKPALACSSVYVHGRGLGSAGTSPNTGSELSVYFVANPNTSLFTFADSKSGKDSTPICFTKNGVNDGPDKEGGFRYKYLAANKFQIYFQGNDAKPMEIEDDKVALSKGQFIDSVRRDATSASFCRWYGVDDVFTQSLTDQQYKNFNFFNCAIMSTMKGAGNVWQYSMCPMDMSEVLVFDRKLTDAEDAAVRGYLAKKWFDSTAAWPELPKTGAVKTVAVSVPAGETGAVAMELAEGQGAVKLVKRGEGTLVDFGATDNGTEIVVEEGTLRYASAKAGETSAAAIWFDATEAETNAEGFVTSVRNKGWAGGSFTPKATAVTGTPTLGAINGVQAVQFDGADDFLRLTTFTNATPRQLYVYMVNQRDEYKTAAGYFSYSQLASDKNDDAQVGAVVAIDNSTSNHQIDAGSVGTNYGTFDNSVPVVDYYLVGDYTVLFGQVNAESSYLSVVQQRNIHANIPSDADRATTNDLFQIGARKNGNDVPRWFFKGKIGEVVVLEQPLNIDQLIELMDYFRAKWMGAEGSKVPPTWLTGRTAASGKGVKLTQKGGSVVEQNGPTVALAAYEAEEGSIIARSVESAGTPLFSVAGDVSFLGPISVDLSPFPQAGQVLVKYAGAAAPVSVKGSTVTSAGAPVNRRVRHSSISKEISVGSAGLKIVVR